ncbi:MAG: PAS domain S-box protein [Oscillospiraceae bacterium]|nr:PAS domain S-box protein [Oscillospiraceae bacterium]
MGVDITIEALFESMPVAMVLLDRKGEHVALNQALASISGKQKQDLIGLKIAQLSAESGRNIVRDFAAFDEGKAVPDHEITIDGKTYYAAVKPLRNAQGYAIGEMVALMNISKTKKLELELEESNRKLLYLSSYDPLTNVMIPELITVRRINI